MTPVIGTDDVIIRVESNLRRTRTGELETRDLNTTGNVDIAASSQQNSSLLKTTAG